MLFVSSIEALSQLVASNSLEPILVGGELVLVSHDRAAVLEISSLTEDRYIAQPPRIASRKSVFDKNKKVLYVSIDRQAVEMVLAYKGQVALSADQYLAYGLSQRNNTVVIGGGDSSKEGRLNLEGFVFTDNRLVSTFEKTAASSGYLLDLVLKDILAEYPEHEVHWSAPLPAIPDCDIKALPLFSEVGEAALKTIVRRKIFSRRQSEEEGWGVIPAIAIAAAGLLVFAGATGYQWSQLESERAEFHDSISGYEEAYNDSTHSLELLRHRDYLLSERSESAEKVAMLDDLIVKVAGIDGVLIHSIKVVDAEPAKVARDSLADIFVLDISIPKNTTLGGAREQAEGLVDKINTELGMTVRVMTHTSFSHRYGSGNKEYWRYTLGGSD